ncbi:SCO family protein [Roseicitreum antarcticum]|uniref:Protein SCO1/2 n=1 Tax=Roseicitreum antarcticum TaxID=564137 RepID=A0A1H3BJ71_9RHOB|nr:SCO family protein [Roseicitreum antarcticum]SDX41761.1 protein SCO1/2 [Roseicitreum antarcticum]
MIKTYTVIAAGLVAVLLGGLASMVFFGQRDEGFAQCRQTTVAGGSGSIGGPFELVDHTGRTVRDTDVIDRPTLIYFGYTFCPDVCPLDNARNAQAADILIDQGVDMQLAFISIDPARDTPEVLAEFVSYMHPEMIGLTGSAEQVRAASQAYKTYYAAQESDDPDYYLVDHTTFSYLVLPEHGFVDVFRRELTPEALAEQVGCFIEAA